MPSLPTTRLRLTVVMAAAIALVLTVSACAAASSAPGTASASTNAVTGLPGAHIHGLSVNGQTGQILLSTHEGLFDVSKKPAVKIGPTNDLMGFTATTDPGVFYASGHPGQDSTLPNPVGLIKTTDGGKTWEQLSRQGESDFHALTTTKSGIAAYDGTIRTSHDGTTWKSSGATFMPAVLAGTPQSDTVLATTNEGIQRSTDGGITWALNPSAPVIQYAAFASAKEAIGVAPDGTVYYSPDAGITWKRTGKIDGQVQALAATEGADGNPWIWAATTTGVVVSTDGGATIRPSDAD